MEDALKALTCAAVEVARAVDYDMTRFPDDLAETIAGFIDANPKPTIRLDVRMPL